MDASLRGLPFAILLRLPHYCTPSLNGPTSTPLSRRAAGRRDCRRLQRPPRADVRRPGQRACETQRFARDVDIVADDAKVPPLRLHIDIPGLVYVTYVKNETATTVGKLKVSGTSKEAVSIVTFDDTSGAVSDLVAMRWQGVENGANITGPHALLVEVELYKKNWLRGLVKYASSDIVILDNVLYLPATKDEDGNDYESSFELAGPSGNIFISDPKAEYTTRTFELFQTALGARETGMFQVEFAKLNKTTGGIFVEVDTNMNATFFVNELSELDVWYEDDAAAKRNGLCVASQSDVSISTRISDGDIHNPKSAVLKAGSSCQRVPLPKREPAVFPEGLSEPAVVYYLDNTPAPLPSGVVSTVAPVPSTAAVPTAAPAASSDTSSSRLTALGGLLALVVPFLY